MLNSNGLMLSPCFIPLSVQILLIEITKSKISKANKNTYVICICMVFSEFAQMYPTLSLEHYLTCLWTMLCPRIMIAVPVIVLASLKINYRTLLVFSLKITARTSTLKKSSNEKRPINASVNASNLLLIASVIHWSACLYNHEDDSAESVSNFLHQSSGTSVMVCGNKPKHYFGF